MDIYRDLENKRLWLNEGKPINYVFDKFNMIDCEVILDSFVIKFQAFCNLLSNRSHRKVKKSLVIPIP